MFKGAGKRAQRGVALISVLLIVAVLLAVVMRLMANHSLVISRHQNAFEQNQALQYTLGAEALAMAALTEDFAAGSEQDHLNEIWAQPTLPFALDEGGFLEARLVDLHNCFNLNTLASTAKTAERLAQMERLLRTLLLPEQIAGTWKDWVDADEVVTKFGAEDSEYLIAAVPHRTPNRPVTDVSELTLLANTDADQRAQLLPHVCVLPTTESRLNINTVSATVLTSLDDAITLAVTEPLAEAPRAFTSVGEFTSANPDFQPFEEYLSVSSEYFTLHARAQVGDSSVTLQSLLFRDPGSGEITVLQRDFGKLFPISPEPTDT